MYYSFFCPGCDETHTIPIKESGWQLSGSTDHPTITPSLLIRSGCKAPSHKAGDECWCTFGGPFKCGVCHLFIRDGKIEYLTDCTHALAGQVIDLPKEKG